MDDRTSTGSESSSKRAEAESLLAGGDFGLSWDPPLVTPPGLKPALEDLLVEAERASAVADRAALSRWLGSLAMLVAPGNLSVADVKAKLSAYAGMLEGRVRVGALTNETLHRVALKHRFLPTYGEIANDLDLFGDIPSRQRQRIATLLGHPPAECGLEGYGLAVRRWQEGPFGAPRPDFRDYCPTARDESSAYAQLMVRAISGSRAGLD